MLLEDMLIDLGYEVIGPAANCAKAFELLHKDDMLDGAILDVNLGGESVFPVAEALAERRVPFVFSTGYGDRAIDARFAGTETLNKPFDFRRVQVVVARCFPP